MSGISFFTIFLCALAVLPVLLVFRIVAVEARRRRTTLYLTVPAWTPEEEEPAMETAAADDHYAFERTHRHLRTTAQCEVDRPLKTSLHEYSANTVASTLNPNAFEYTIRRHDGAVKQEALNMGGFSQVPLLLYDRAGNCFTVHRRLSLN